MTSIPLPIFVAVFFFLGGALILELHHRYQEKMRALPLRDDFMARHAQTAPNCHCCGSASLDEKGLSHGNDRNRVVSCAQCHTLLYRVVDLARGDTDDDWTRD